MWRFLPKCPWLPWKSKTRYLGWVFTSSDLQRNKRLLSFDQGIEWILNIKETPNIEFFKEHMISFFGKNTSQFWLARYLQKPIWIWFWTTKRCYHCKLEKHSLIFDYFITVVTSFQWNNNLLSTNVPLLFRLNSGFLMF